jgi:hypothetical protein
LHLLALTGARGPPAWLASELNLRISGCLQL